MATPSVAERIEALSKRAGPAVPKGFFGRLRARMSITWNEGTLWFATSVLLFSISVWIWSHVLTMRLLRERYLLDETQELLHAKNERADGNLSGVLRAVLQDTPSVVPVPDEVETYLLGFEEATAQAAELSAWQHCAPRVELASPAARAAEWGQALCRRPVSGSGVLVVPSTVWPDRPGDAPLPANGDWGLDHFVARDGTLAWAASLFAAGVAEPPSEVVQTYFVSPASVVAIRPATHLPDVGDDLLRNPLYASGAASYVTAFIEGVQRTPGRLSTDLHVTNVYLDRGGVGLVRSFCRAVTHDGSVAAAPPALEPEAGGDASKPSPTPTETGSWFVGVICADVRVPVPSLFTGEHIHVVEEGRRYRSAAFDLFVLGPYDEMDGVRVAERPGGGPNGRPDLSHVVQFGRGFLLRTGSDGAVDSYLYVRSRFVTPWRDYGLLLLSAVFFVLSLYLLVRGAADAAAARERRSRGVILRNLQVGVVEVDHDQFIVAANERAEEVFGVPLNRFGQRVQALELCRHLPTTMRGGIIRIPRTRHALAPPEEAVQRGSTTRGERRAGWSIRFYARLAHGPHVDRWVLFLASPLVTDPEVAGAGLPPSFGVVEFVRPELAQELDRVWRSGEQAFKDRPVGLEVLEAEVDAIERRLAEAGL